MEQASIRTEGTTMEADTLKVLENLTPAEKLDAIEFLVGALRRSSNHAPTFVSSTAFQRCGTPRQAA